MTTAAAGAGNTMPEAAADIMRRACEAIGDNPPGQIDVPSLADQVRDLPDEAGPLRRILEREVVRKAEADRNRYCVEAERAQATYNRSVLTIILLVFTALAVGLAPAVAPALLLGTTEAAAKWVATALIYAALLFSLLIARRLEKRETYETWSEARGSAEYVRRKVLELIMQADEPVRPGELPLWPLKIEYFRRYQFDVQETYHNRRASENERIAKIAKALIVPCALSVLVWLLALAAEVMAAWGEQGPLPAVVPAFAYRAMSVMQRLTMDYTDIKWLAVGLGTAGVYALVFLLTTLNGKLRNAARFRRSAENFAHLRSKDLEAARRAAASEPADVAGVMGFVGRVHAIMSNELSDWVRLAKLDTGAEHDAANPPLGATAARSA